MAQQNEHSVVAHRGSFGPASELPFRRRTSDRLRLFVALVLAAGLVARHGTVSTGELDLFRLFNQLPNDLRPVFAALYALGALWAVGVVVAAALVGRRWRLARDLAIAGVLAWFVGRFLAATVVDNQSVTAGLHAVVRFGHDVAGFPQVRLAVIVAVISTASPYLTRPFRRAGQLLVLSMAVAAMYLGTGLPDAVLAGILLGWAVAAAVHLAFGSPGGRPTIAQVQITLGELGAPVDRVSLADTQPSHATRMSAVGATGRLDLRVLGRDEADAQFLAKAWRVLMYKDSGSRLAWSRLEDVEHEAYALLFAAHAGVRVPDVVVAGRAGPGMAMLATRSVPGVALAQVPASEITDAALTGAWHEVTTLRAANMAHGKLNATHVVVEGEVATIVDLDAATVAASPAELDADTAEFLVSTAGIVGVERAVRVACEVVEPATLRAALPLLQPGALSSELRPRSLRSLKEFKEEVTAVRSALATALAVEEPPLQPLYRVDAAKLLMAIGSLIAVFALLGQVGDLGTLWDTLTAANWWWVAGALVVSFLTNFATAVSLMGTVPMGLPLLRTAQLQLAMSFSNLAIPAVGGMASQIRYLQKQGLDLASAVASGGLLANLGNIVASLLLFVVALGLSPQSFSLGNIPTSSVVGIVLGVIVVVLIVSGFVFGIPRLRRVVLPAVHSAASTIWGAVRSPRRVLQLLGGNMANAVMYALVLDLCIAAFGGSIDFWSLLAANIGIGTLASLVPIPGGGTAVASVGMSGALVGFGVPTDVAVAAVLMNQLVTTFVPALPGFWATNNLLRDGYL